MLRKGLHWLQAKQRISYIAGAADVQDMSAQVYLSRHSTACSGTQ